MSDYLYIKATQCEKLSRPPIWIMRQAGRYMPEYMAIKEKYSFLDMVKNPELSTEITLQPIKAFGMDAAILFSDILVTAEAMGLKLDFIAGSGPTFESTIRNEDDLKKLSTEGMTEKLSYVTNAIKSIQHDLTPFNIPLIGFAGAPFTVASYMVEGKSSKDLKTTKQLMYRNPEVFHGLLKKLTIVTIDYLNMQIKAGVNALQIFDTWAGLLGYEAFKEVSYFYIKHIIENLDNPKKIPITVFCKGCIGYLSDLKNIGANVIGLDWACNIVEARQSLPQNIAIQGNLDPYIVYSDKTKLKESVTQLLSQMAPYSGHIFNLGHGILPDMKPDHIKCIVDTVKSFEAIPSYANN